MTLLVIPAPDLHPFFQRRARARRLAAGLPRRAATRSPSTACSTGACAGRGPLRRPLAAWQGGAAAEFPGLDASETDASVEAGRRMLARAGLEPRGFVAPAYAYTPALRAALAQSLRLVGDAARRCWRADARPAARPALCLGTSSRLKLALSPLIVRAGAATAGRVLRLDLHPADFEHPRHVLALEAVLRNARGRQAVTYDELC